MMDQTDKTRFRPVLLTAAPTFAAWARDRRIPFKELEGCYKGQREKTYLVAAPHIGTVQASGIMAGEESALLLTGQPVDEPRGHRFAYLAWLDSTGQVWELDPLGNWRAVSAHEAVGRDAWTYDPATAQYFVAGPAPEAPARIAPYEAPGLGFRSQLG